MESKTGKRIAGALLVLISAVVLLAPSAAWAVEADQAQLSVVLQSDGDAYVSGDAATFDATIQNTGDVSVDAIEYAYNAPGDMTVAEDSSLVGSIGSLAPGEAAHAILKVNVDVLAQPLPGVSEGLVSTGEMPIAAIICAIVLGALLVVMVASKKARNVGLSLILVCGFTGALSTASLSQAHADQAKKSTTANCAVSVNGNDVTVGVTVAYLGAVSQDGTGDVDDPTDEDEPIVTRAQWIDRLLTASGVRPAESAQHPYKDIAGHEFEAAIATAYDRGVIPGEGTAFEPDAPATREFALATAVLASGFTDDGSTLEAADAAEAEYPALLAIALDLGMSVLDDQGNINPKDNLVETDAKTILAGVAAVFAPSESGSDGTAMVEFQDDVTHFDEYTIEGGSFVVDADCAGDLSVGDKIALLPTEASSSGAAGRVTEIEDIDSSKVRVSYEQATDATEYLGSFEIVENDVVPDLSSVVLEDGIELVESAGTFARSSGDLGKLSVEIPNSLGLDGKVSIKPVYDVDIKWTLFGGFERCKIEAGAELEVEGGVSADLVKKKSDVKIGTVPFPLPAGFSLNADIYLHFTVEGEITVKLAAQQTTGLELKSGHWRPYADGDTEASVEASAKGELGVAPAAAVNWAGFCLVDLSTEIGLALEGSGTIRDTGMLCTDVAGYLYDKVSVGEYSDILKKIKLTWSKKLWSEKNSPFKFAFHWEDHVYVDECTYEDDNEEGDGSEGSDDEGANVPIDPNETFTSSDGFVYRVVGEQSEETKWGYGAWIIGYEGDRDSVTIPVTIDGYEVIATTWWRPDIASVSFQNGSKIKEFECRGDAAEACKLEHLDLSNAKNLELLQIVYSNIASLDLSSNAELKDAWCPYNNKLVRVDLSGAAKLVNVNFNYCSLTSLNVDMNPSIESLECRGDGNGGGLFGLDVSGCSSLKHLDLEGASLSMIDLSKNTNLESLNVSGNRLSDLDVSANPAIKHLECNLNSLEELNLSGNPTLETLSCAENRLTTLDVSDNPALLSISCFRNEISNLDISNCANLNSLIASRMSLSHLDISKNVDLAYLDVSYNSLTELDISNNPVLDHLYIIDNQLSELDISSNHNLQWLSCNGNKISDMSAIRTWFEQEGHFGVIDPQNI